MEGKQSGKRESLGIQRLDRECVLVRTCWFALYERRVAKPLSICNPDRDAFAPRFKDEPRQVREEDTEGREKRGEKSEY